MFPLLLTCLISFLSQADSIPLNVKEMTYIGSYNGSMNGEYSGGHTLGYFISPGSGTWAEGESVCKSIYGPEGRLVAFDTPEKKAFIYELIDNYNLFGIYWTCGLYHPDSNAWAWPSPAHDSYVTLPNWAPWDPAYYPPPTDTRLRLALDHKSQYDGKWIPLMNTEVHHYICEFRE